MEIKRFSTWADFKTRVSNETPMYYDESGDRFTKLFIIDGPITYEHEIFVNGFFPVACYMTEAENTSNKAEFEASYKANAVKVG